MNPSKRKWLARLEAAKKTQQEEVKASEPIVEAKVEQPVVVSEQVIEEKVASAPVQEEVTVAPTVVNKKKKS